MTTALVTGGHGFVGTHLCELLDASGWDAVALGRTPRDLPGRRSVAIDLTAAMGLDEILDAIRPDVVFHLAGPSVRDAADPGPVVRDIVESTYRLLLALRRTGLRPRVVLAGSSAQYGDLPRAANPIDEDAPFRPISPYGHAKVAAEAVARALSADGSVELIAVRPFNHIGPGEPATTVTAAVAGRIAAVVHGSQDAVTVRDLDAVRDFTDVRDIARGYVAVAESGTPGSAYNLCSGRPVSVADLVASLLRQAGLDRSVLQVVEAPPGPIAYQVGSPARVRAASGWSADIPFDESVAAVLETVGVGVVPTS
jgi:GDP-4-dehydro-6-deoxy-D-mannose reductase